MMEWEDGAEIRFRMYQGEAVLSANPAGLRSLARLFSLLAEEPPTSHYHLVYSCLNKDIYHALQTAYVEPLNMVYQTFYFFRSFIFDSNCDNFITTLFCCFSKKKRKSSTAS